MHKRGRATMVRLKTHTDAFVQKQSKCAAPQSRKSWKWLGQHEVRWRPVKQHDTLLIGEKEEHLENFIIKWNVHYLYKLIWQNDKWLWDGGDADFPAQRKFTVANTRCMFFTQTLDWDGKSPPAELRETPLAAGTRFRRRIDARNGGWDLDLLNPLRSWLEVEKGSSLCRVLTLVVLLSAVVTGPISLCWVELLAVSFCFFANFLWRHWHIHTHTYTDIEALSWMCEYTFKSQNANKQTEQG